VEASFWPEEETLRQAFTDLVLDESYPCVGAKSSVRRGDSPLRLYPTLGSAESTKALAEDLQAFVVTHVQDGDGFCSFVACFSYPKGCEDEEFERLLWSQLRQLSDVDGCGWDSAVSRDPRDPDFAFSFAGSAFFVVGLHPTSSRPARQFAVPTLVFNLHRQFRRLRGQGHYERMRAIIRERDLAFAGSINPMLGDFGRRSEARQYSGRLVDEDWECPFSSNRLDLRQ
jgi:FPC/CPF motif-containing protein YcgG